MAREIEEKRWNVPLEETVLEKMPELEHVRPGATDENGEPRKVFAIDTPPPYPSGRWHIGAVAHYSLIDVIARSRRMMGEEVLFPWGVDRNGINIELVVEKKSNKRLQQWDDRGEFIEACHKAIQKNSDSLEDIARRVAMSCDFDNAYYTDSPEYRAVTQRIFLDLFKKGEIVEDLRPNTFDPVLGTTIADAEVYYVDKETELVTVRWEVEGGGELHISTTRPELICACQVILVHPDDDRYADMIGKKVHVPLYDRTVEVQAHEHVATDFGTGVMMVCSYGDQADVQLFRELQLEPIAAIGPDGLMTEAAGPLEGTFVRKAKKQMIELLDEAGLIVERETIQNKVPTSERSKSPVEIILLKEWYVRQTHLVDELREVAKAMDFHPSKHRQILLDWIDTVSIDWPISRRRYYHTEIPLWFLQDGEGNATDWIILPPEGPYYTPWKDEPPEGSIVVHRETREEVGDLASFLKEHEDLVIVGETKVFDTWMDSSNSNLYVLGYGEHDEFVEKNFPTSLRPQGRDIVRTWLYYTALKSKLVKNSKPFEHVWITGLGMDEHGRKMSKSVGNVIEPEKVLDKFGADAFRFWIASECTIGDDFRISEDRINGAKKFLTKLFNVARFVSRFDQHELDGEPKHPLNRWALAEFDELVRTCRAGYEDLDFFRPATAIRHFVWETFASHYLEMAKGMAYDDDEETLATLHNILGGVVKLLAPISPIISYHLHNTLYEVDPHTTTFPEALPEDSDVRDLVKLTETVTAFNKDVWKRKKDAGISLRDGISGVELPQELEPMRDVLTNMHGLE